MLIARTEENTLPKNTLAPQALTPAEVSELTPEGAFDQLLLIKGKSLQEACKDIGLTPTHETAIRDAVRKVARAMHIQHSGYTQDVVNELATNLGISERGFEKILGSSYVAAAIKEFLDNKEEMTDAARAKALALAYIPKGIEALKGMVDEGDAATKLKAVSMLATIADIMPKKESEGGSVGGVQIIVQQGAVRPGAVESKGRVIEHE